MSSARKGGIRLHSGYVWPQDRYQVLADRLDGEPAPEWSDEQWAQIADTVRTAAARQSDTDRSDMAS